MYLSLRVNSSRACRSVMHGNFNIILKPKVCSNEKAAKAGIENAPCTLIFIAYLREHYHLCDTRHMCSPSICVDEQDRGTVYSEQHLMGVSPPYPIKKKKLKDWLTPARIILESSQPKLAITYVRVHILSAMKTHARTRNAIAILSCCSIRCAMLSELCTPIALWYVEKRSTNSDWSEVWNVVLHEASVLRQVDDEI